MELKKTSATKCINPFVSKEHGLLFPCNKCGPCRKRKISEWSFRLVQESKEWDECYFITLTYDTEHMDFTEHGYKTLETKKLLNWIKQLRRRNGKFKYFAVGEYGTENDRPHVHILTFGLELETILNSNVMAKVARQNSDFMMDGKYQYDKSSWKKGYITIGQVEGASIGYCLVYIGCQTDIRNKWDDRKPEFRLMSKGIGLGYITQETRNFHLGNPVENNCLYVENGVKACMPRYYRDKIYDDEAKLQLQIMSEENRRIDEEELNGLSREDYIKMINYRAAVKATLIRRHLNKKKDKRF